MSFASTTDLAEKKVSFEELGPGLYGYTAEGDPNSGVIIGDDSVLVVDAQATPRMAQPPMSVWNPAPMRAPAARAAPIC